MSATLHPMTLTEMVCLSNSNQSKDLRIKRNASTDLFIYIKKTRKKSFSPIFLQINSNFFFAADICGHFTTIIKY